MQRTPDIDTHFRIASNTQTMTAAVILQLAQEGKLSLDDPVSEYVPDEPDGDQITITDLLRRRSDLYNYTNSPALAASLDADPTKVWTPQELLGDRLNPTAQLRTRCEVRIQQHQLRAARPHQEEAGGQALATAFEERLFEPLGMEDTVLLASDSNRIPEPFTQGYLYGIPRRRRPVGRRRAAG